MKVRFRLLVRLLRSRELEGKSRTWIVRRSPFLLANIVLLNLFLTGCSSEEDNPLTAGRLSDTGYQNSVLGMTVSFPPSWRVVPNQQEKFATNEKEGILFSLQKPVDRDGSGPVVTAILQLPKAPSAEIQLREVVDERRRTRPNASIGEVKTGKIAGRDFAMVQLSGRDPIAHYLTFHRGYAISFVGVYGNAAEFDEIRRILHSLNFS